MGPTDCLLDGRGRELGELLKKARDSHHGDPPSGEASRKLWIASQILVAAHKKLRTPREGLSTIGISVGSRL